MRKTDNKQNGSASLFGEMDPLMKMIVEFQKAAEADPELYKTLREKNSHITSSLPTPLLGAQGEGNKKEPELQVQMPGGNANEQIVGRPTAGETLPEDGDRTRADGTAARSRARKVIGGTAGELHSDSALARIADFDLRRVTEQPAQASEK